MEDDRKERRPLTEPSEEESGASSTLSPRLPGCPYCGSMDNPKEETYCRVCGVSLERK